MNGPSQTQLGFALVLILLSLFLESLATNCPSATPYSDTPSCLAKQKCEAPQVICCPYSGNCGYSSTSASSTSTATTSRSSSSSSSPSESSASPSSSSSPPGSSAFPSSSSPSGTSAFPSSSSQSESSSFPSSSYSVSFSTESSFSPFPSSSFSPCTPYYSSSQASSVSNTFSSAFPESSSIYSSAASESSSAASESSSSSSAFSESPTSGFPSSSFPNSSPSGSSFSSSSPSSSSYQSSSPSGSSSSSPANNSSTSTAASTPSGSYSTSVGSKEPCPCRLIIALLEFMYAQLTAAEQSIFEQECLYYLRIILVDVSLTVEQKIVKCGYVIRSFCVRFPSIGDRCKFVQIDQYGFVYDFAFVVAIAYEDEMVDSVCNSIDITGSSNLTVALTSGTSQNQCSSNSSSTMPSYVSRVKQLNRRTLSTINKARRLSFFYDTLKYIYFEQYPEQEECVKNISINTGNYSGSVGQFLSFCSFYAIETSVLTSVLVDNSSTGVCPFISSCQAGINSANSSGSANSSVIQEAQAFIDYCRQQFTVTISAQIRLQILVARFQLLSFECRLLLKRIRIVGAVSDCICADVIAVSNACDNGYACGNLTYGGPGESLDETCQIDKFNISTIVQASQNYLDSVSPSIRLGYRSFHNSIVNCCYSSQFGSNQTARIECAKRYVTNYSVNNAVQRAIYLATELSTVFITRVTNTVISAFYGTFGCFCGCGSC